MSTFSSRLATRKALLVNLVALCTIIGQLPTYLVAQAQSVPSFVVTSTGDSGDSAIGNGVCATSTGPCTLRAAIQEANSAAGPSAISFNIAGTGPHTIKVSSQLPALSNTGGGITVNGYSQPGSQPNTHTTADNAVIRIQLEGSGASGHDGFRVTSGGNTIRGLAIYKFSTAINIVGLSADNNVVVGNFIGTNAGATFGVLSNVSGASGIEIRQGASSNLIGRPNAADRNVVSGSGHQGIAVYDAGSNANVIQNNLVGLHPSGTARLPNRQHGIDVNYGSSSNQIGGSGPMERNVVSGNAREGIEISHGSDTRFNKVIGNLVGTTVDGSSSQSYTRNGNAGIRLEDNVGDTVVRDNVVGNNGAYGILIDRSPKRSTVEANYIGVTRTGTPIPNNGPGIALTSSAQSSLIRGNVIARNAGDGIRVLGSGTNRNKITRNSIYSNGLFGIDVEPIGVVNDQAVVESGSGGPTEKIAIPVIEGTSSSVVQGRTCAGCSVELFEADGPATAHGEGKRYVVATTADSSGYFELPATGVQGKVVTTLAIDARGNTSEFSRNAEVPTPVPGNVAPIPRFTANCNGTDCTFDGSGSSDEDGTIILWMWDFGDSTTGGGSTATHRYANAGNYNVTLTVTDDGGASASTTQSISAQEPPPSGSLASDRFNRTSSGGWGSAEVGGSWSHNKPSSFSVNGSRGITEAVAPGSDQVAYLPAISETATDVTVSFTADKQATGFGHLVSVVGRRVAHNVEYRARVRLAPSGSVNVAPVKVTGTSSERLIAPEVVVPDTVFATDQLIRTRIQVSGLSPTRIRIKTWDATDPEPSAWNVDVTDSEPSLQAAGSIGVRAFLSGSSTNAPVIYSFEDFQASALNG